MGNVNVVVNNSYACTNMQGIFISGSAGSIFYFATAIVVVIYCESTLVFDMIAIILAFAMNVQCFICQVQLTPYGPFVLLSSFLGCGCCIAQI